MAVTAFPLNAIAGQPEYSGKMLRGALSALMPPPPTGRPLGAASGVRQGTPATTVSVAGSTCTINPHSGVLDVQASATAGPYCYAVTAAETKAVPAAHATYTRWDRVSVQLADPSEGDGTGAPGVAIVYAAGTAAASPAMPAAPARSLTLARVVVPPSGGGAASVVWLAPEVASTPPWYPDTQARDAAIPSAAATTGQVAAVGSGAAAQMTIWDGTTWHTVWQRLDPVTVGTLTSQRLSDGTQIVYGRVAINGLAANTPGSQAIVFPQPFVTGSTPRITAATFGSVPLSAGVSVTALSATGVTVWGQRTTAGDLPIDIHVIGRWRA
ncbi:MAG: hypothetical protein QM804_10370 [Propionicimonas sp.]